jgi:hypothetical protein
MQAGVEHYGEGDMTRKISLSATGIRFPRLMTIGIVTASLFGIAGTVQTAEVRHQEGEHLKPTGKGWGEHDETGRSARNARTSGNAMFYHGGPVMLGVPNIYYIWYGNWSDNTAPGILTNLAQNFFGSPYYNINSTYYYYYDGTRHPISGHISYVGSIGSTTDNYSQGTALSDDAVQNIVATALTSNALPTDPNGVYFVLTSADVNETSGFCRQYCAWHTNGTINGQDIKFAFVGNPDRCPFACAAQTTSPNGNAGADGMASMIAHELSEMVTDPDLNAWYDQRGNENADKCAWNFGTTQRAPNGSRYNVTLGTMRYLLQQIWANASGGYCAIQYP